MGNAFHKLAAFEKMS